MRLVLDTNVVASALLWGGVPRALLQAGYEKRVELFHLLLVTNHQSMRIVSSRQAIQIIGIA